MRTNSFVLRGLLLLRVSICEVGVFSCVLLTYQLLDSRVTRFRLKNNQSYVASHKKNLKNDNGYIKPQESDIIYTVICMEWLSWDAFIERQNGNLILLGGKAEKNLVVCS